MGALDFADSALGPGMTPKLLFWGILVALTFWAALFLLGMAALLLVFYQVVVGAVLGVVALWIIYRGLSTGERLYLHIAIGLVLLALAIVVPLYLLPGWV